MTFLELAQEVLDQSNYPLSSSQIWKQANVVGLVDKLDSQGKTPASTLASQLYTRTKLRTHHTIGYVDDIRPVRFLIKGKQYPPDAWNFSKDDPDNSEKELKYKESDLHSLLAYYIREDLYAYPKTIRHNVSKKVRYRQWEHPDVVACFFPEGFWNSAAYELANHLGQNELEFYSFEIKKSLSFSNLRESFFQTVSNSSWANKSYLVAAEISKDVEFERELMRLCESFGIGVIELDVDDPDFSNTYIEPKERKNIDWNTVDKLSGNKDFKGFIDRVLKDLNSKEVRDEWYDELRLREDLIKEFTR